MLLTLELERDFGRRCSLLFVLLRAVAVRVSSNKIETQKLTDCLPLGIIASPNYADSPSYPRYLQKTDIIRVESEKILRLEFTFFEVGGSYCNDFVEITDGNGATLLEKTCGQTADSSGYDYFELPVIFTTTNTAIISFYTNTNHARRRGWSLSWSAVSPGPEVFCGF